MKGLKIFFLFGVFILLVGIFFGCEKRVVNEENPGWIIKLIATFASEPVGNPPQSIWQYEYKGQRVYYIPPQCCDQFSTLYDAAGNVICAPDGGYTGEGDGRCTDFFKERKNEKLIWQDSRTN